MGDGMLAHHTLGWLGWAGCLPATESARATAPDKGQSQREGGACFRWEKLGVLLRRSAVQPKRAKKDGLQAVWRHRPHPSAAPSGLAAAARNAKLVSSSLNLSLCASLGCLGLQ